jgi:hypothetical protein
MSWEQDISEKLQEVQDVAVRFDIPQDLNNTEKTTARTNIGIGATATLNGGDDYKITL